MVWPTADDIKRSAETELNTTPPGQQIKAAFATNSLDHILKLNLKEEPGCQRLTNIMAAIGKSSNTAEVVEQLMASGMNIALIKLYFASKEENIELIKTIKKAAKNYCTTVGRTYPLAIAVRLSGRKIRTGQIAENFDESVELHTGEFVKITCDENYRSRCSAAIIFVDYMYFITQIKVDHHVLLDNEIILLKVVSIGTTSVMCLIERGGTLGSYKDVVIPYAIFDMPNFSERDKEYIDVAIHHQVDIVTSSIVNSAQGVLELRQLLGEKGRKIAILADIETLEGVRNFDSIMQVADGIMISRKELGTSTKQKNMILMEKHLIARANKANVSVTVSAQFLYNMRYKDLPLRSELLDIGNCILNGADGLVLSAETAIGLYPVESLKVLAAACKDAEACLWTKRVFSDLLNSMTLPIDHLSGLGLAAVSAANKMAAAAIVVLTQNMSAIKVVSMFKPRCPIIAVTRNVVLARQLHLWRAVMPLIFEDPPEADWQFDAEKRVCYAINFGITEGFIIPGDHYVVVSSWESSSSKMCNMRVETVKG